MSNILARSSHRGVDHDHQFSDPFPEPVSALRRRPEECYDWYDNDWYDNDHVPLCIHTPSFHSWSHWVAVDDEQPSHLALYDTDSPESVNNIPYASFTDRDHSALGLLALVNCPTYILHEPVHPPAMRVAYSQLVPARFISSIVMDIPAEHVADFDRWHDEEHILDIAKIPGWVRTRRFVFADASLNPVLAVDEGLSSRPGKERPHRFLMLHKWESPAAIATSLTLKLKRLTARFEARLFKLHKY